MLYLHRGGRLEDLAAGLVAVCAAPLASPLNPEIVLVQSNGMARWLSLRLADHRQICSNVRFPFPAAYGWELFRALHPQLPELSGFEPAVLAWRIFELLPRLAGDPLYAEPTGYLANGDALTRYELSRRLADVFDQYLVYRPDWIVDWEQGGGEGWQPALWRELTKDGNSHRAALLLDTVDRLQRQAPPAGVLPERLLLFGIASLPASQVALLEALARHVEVHLFLLDPSEAYWGEIRSPKEIARGAGDADPEDLYLETGNKLLASLGRQGRDFMDLLLEANPSPHEYFEAAPAPDCLLAALQDDIRRLRNRGEGEPPTPLAPGDDSLQVHSCHSRMREVEVLHDQLLGLFDSHPELGPADVVVMTPDIDAYAPYVEAVFVGEPRIPFAIADRSLRRQQPVLECVLSLLELRDGRFEADRVLALLEVPALQQRFGFSPAELPMLQDWIRQTGIRWGIDAEHRAGLGLPAVADHSWRLGLDRMLLGYAMPAGERRLFAGILPFDGVEGSGGELAGCLLAFTDALFALPSQLAEERPAQGWRELLNRLIDDFFARATDEEETALGRLRQLLDDLLRATEQAGVSEPLPIALIAAQLRRDLESPEGGSSFLSGGVTFCAMVPMRSIPFQVVCLLGMNDGEFPRQQRSPGFDLMARQPRRGDRSRRFEDRYLFLEALLSARRCLYLSYIGQDIRDNSSRPPSVVVDDLLDCVDRGWQSASGGAAREQLVTRHRLQAFSREYFVQPSAPETAGRLFSYAAHLPAAAALAGRGRREAASLFGAPLPAPEAQWRELDLRRLIKFFGNPAEFLLRQRLGLVLGEQEGLLDGREPFLLDGLQGWQLDQDLLGFALNESDDEPEPLARAAGRLPHGEVGRQQLATHWADLQDFLPALRPLLDSKRLPPRPFALEIDGFRLLGVLDRLSPEGRWDYRFGSDRGKDLLGVWISHLVLNALAPAGAVPRSRWVSRRTEAVLAPVADARAQLAVLLGYYWRGLSEPLPLFPKASRACAEAMRKGADGVAAAAKPWYGNDHQEGECEQPYLRLAFGGADPLRAPLFAELAEAVWLPLLAALEGGS